MLQTEPIAVLAGTPVDTQMGVDILSRASLYGLAFPLAQNPLEQTSFQISAPAEKYAAVRETLKNAQQQGCRRAFVYCNSLSSSVDFPALSRELGMPIVTPLEVYQSLAPQWQRLGLIAANAQGLAGIERALYTANPSLELLGTCLLPVVLSIESKESPESLVARHHLPELVNWFARCGMEALVLGCTHFPYFKEELARQTTLPLIDPAEEMVHLLMTSSR